MAAARRGRAPRGRCRSRGRARAAACPRPARARAAGRRRRSAHSTSCQIPRCVSPTTRGASPAPASSVAQLEQRRVGGEGEERPVSAARDAPVERARRASRSTRAGSASTPAYFSRSAISSARVPEQVDPPHAAARAARSRRPRSRRRRGRRRCGRSARARGRARPSSSVSVRSTSFAPAGFLTSRIETSRPVDRDRLHAAERGGEALERGAGRRRAERRARRPWRRPRRAL